VAHLAPPHSRISQESMTTRESSSILQDGNMTSTSVTRESPLLVSEPPRMPPAPCSVRFLNSLAPQCSVCSRGVEKQDNADNTLHSHTYLVRSSVQLAGARILQVDLPKCPGRSATAPELSLCHSMHGATDIVSYSDDLYSRMCAISVGRTGSPQCERK